MTVTPRLARSCTVSMAHVMGVGGEVLAGQSEVLPSALSPIGGAFSQETPLGQIRRVTLHAQPCWNGGSITVHPTLGRNLSTGRQGITAAQVTGNGEKDTHETDAFHLCESDGQTRVRAGVRFFTSRQANPASLLRVAEGR